MSAEVKKVLEDALRYIREHGWHQGDGGRGDNGEVCAVWALVNVRLSDDTPLLAARNLLEATAGIRYNTLHRWNDLPTTSLEDVELLFKKAMEEVS